MIIDLKNHWRYWDMFSHIIQRFGAFNPRVAKRINKYCFNFHNHNIGRKFSLAIDSRMKKLIGFSRGYLYPREKKNHSIPTLATDWKKVGCNIGIGGIDCPCCAPPAPIRKKYFYRKMRNLNKRLILKEIKDLEYDD